MSAETPVPAPKKTPGKGKIIGGCCGIILVFVILIGACSAIFGGESTTDEPKPAATTSKPPATKAPASKAPTQAKPTTTAPTTKAAPSTKAVPASTTPAAKPTTKAPSKPAGQDPQKWAAGIEKDTLLLSGGSTWREACGGDYSRGICWISQVKAKKVGDLDVTLQLRDKDEESEKYAQEAASFIFATAGPEHKELQTITVYDAAGVELYRTERSDNPMLD